MPLEGPLKLVSWIIPLIILAIIILPQAIRLVIPPVTNDFIRKDLGLPEGAPLTIDALESIRNDAGKAYDALRKESFNATPEYKTQINTLGREYQAIVKDVPEMADPKIDGLIKALDKPSFSGDTAVALIKRLRSHGNSNLSNPMASPDAKDLGNAQVSAAKALEDMIEVNLSSSGKTSLLNDYRSSRQLIAKTYDAEKALNDATGDISAQSLARQSNKKAMSGGIETAAKAGKMFPMATQAMTASVPGITPLDVAAGGMGSMAMGSPGVLAAWLGIRPAVRSMILSSPYQSLMGSPSYPLSRLPSQENAALRGVLSPAGALYQ